MRGVRREGGEGEERDALLSFLENISDDSSSSSSSGGTFVLVGVLDVETTISSQARNSQRGQRKEGSEEETRDVTRTFVLLQRRDLLLSPRPDSSEDERASGEFRERNKLGNRLTELSSSSPPGGPPAEGPLELMDPRVAIRGPFPVRAGVLNELRPRRDIDQLQS